MSEPFEVTTGVLQGDTLAPFLFVVVLDYSLRKIPGNYGFITQQDPYHDRDFVDNITLLDESTTTASNHFTTLAQQVSGVGLQVNMDKTKYMTFATMQGDVGVPGLGSLQQVDDLKYLGSNMASSQADIANRRGQACGAIWNMKAL